MVIETWVPGERSTVQISWFDVTWGPGDVFLNLMDVLNNVYRFRAYSQEDVCIRFKIEQSIS